MTRKCPHEDVQYCPLYHACHEGGAGGCDDGKIDENSCAVDRGRMEYGPSVRQLRKTHPLLVAQCEMHQVRSATRGQIRRNLKHNGLH